jgi:hypothetical protein
MTLPLSVLGDSRVDVLEKCSTESVRSREILTTTASVLSDGRIVPGVS